MENKEQGYNLTSTKHTEVSFDKIPFKLRLKAFFGGKLWITTRATIQIKQDIAPTPIDDSIEIFINSKTPNNGK